jgi:hypothetical protein
MLFMSKKKESWKGNISDDRTENGEKPEEFLAEAA